MAENNTTTAENNTPGEGKTTKFEIIITVLLGASTVLGALAAYCAALWGGELQSSYAKSIAGTNEANTIYLEALSDLSAFEMNDLKDDILYTQWKDNNAKGDEEDAKYFFSKLSEGLQKDLSDNPADVSEYEKEQQATLDSINERLKLAEENITPQIHLCKREIPQTNTAMILLFALSYSRSCFSFLDLPH